MKVPDPHGTFRIKSGIRVLILNNSVCGYCFPSDAHPKTMELSLTTLSLKLSKIHQQIYFAQASNCHLISYHTHHCPEHYHLSPRLL